MGGGIHLDEVCICGVWAIPCGIQKSPAPGGGRAEGWGWGGERRGLRLPRLADAEQARQVDRGAALWRDVQGDAAGQERHGDQLRAPGGLQPEDLLRLADRDMPLS